MSNTFTVSLISWRDGEPLLKSVRQAVFVEEQGIPEDLEWDGRDETCRHALALSLEGQAIGCGRIKADGHIGRIAVLPEWRNKKVGTTIMEALLNHARALHYPAVDVDAQVHAVPFYRTFGFEAEGETFLDAGLPHIKMRLSLSE